MKICSILFVYACLIMLFRVFCFTPKTNANRRKVIIDVDAGIDDAWAIVLLLNNEENYNIQVVGVTCTHGNTEVEKVAINVLRIITALNRTDIPIYIGASESLVTPTQLREEYFHGRDGWGDLNKTNEELNEDLIQKEHAITFLYRTITDNPKDVTIISIGPLTNLATLLKWYPKVKDDIKELFIMGGNEYGVGNVQNYAAEFNFFTDPEAASIVFDNFKRNITLLPWETNLLPNLLFSKTWRFSVLGHNKDLEIVRLMNEVEEKIYTDWEDYMPCDAIVSAYFLNPSIITKKTLFSGKIELNGKLTRGQLVLDHMKKGTGNIAVVEQVEEKLLKQILLNSVESCVFKNEESEG